MKTTLTKVMIALQALAALAMIGAVKIWAPVCGKMLTLESGREVHMKCFYSGQAAVVIAVILLAVAVITFVAARDYRKMAIVSIVVGVALFMLFTNNVIGICANAEMSCNSTALWGKICAAVTVVSSLVILFSGKEGQLPS